MVRSRVVFSFLIVLLVSFVHPIVATAGPIVIYAERVVVGYTGVPRPELNNYNEQRTNATSGSFVGHLAAAETELDGLAAYQADQNTSILPFVIGGTGSASSSIQPLTPGVQAHAAGRSYLLADFMLDGNYDYDLSGVVGSNRTLDGVGYGYAHLSSYDNGAIHQAFTSDGPLPFLFSGTLSAGRYQVFFDAYTTQNDGGLVAGSAAANSNFNGTFTLSPAAVPDQGDAAILFLLSSAFLGALALQKRRRNES